MFSFKFQVFLQKPKGEKVVKSNLRYMFISSVPTI